jgi:hypothetical protein
VKKGPKTSFHAVITPPNPAIWLCSNPKIFTKPHHGICASDPARKPSLLHPAIDDLLLSPEGSSIRLFLAFESPPTSPQASFRFKPKPETDFRLIRRRRSFQIHFLQVLTPCEQNRSPEGHEFFFSP